MLTERREKILESVVQRYVATATPVPSEVIAHTYPLKFSPATIRNEMGWLEEEGYITRPHVSAGCIPSDKGYRYYVEILITGTMLPLWEQHMIRRLFYQVELEFEEWVHLAAALLAQKVMNVAVVTLPRARECQFKHLDIVRVQDSLILLILVLWEARLRRQLMSVERAVPQDKLTEVANKLNHACFGLTRSQIRAQDLELSVFEERVVEVVREMMRSEDEEAEEPYLEGLHHFLNQPEFASTERMLSMIEALEEKSPLKSLLSSVSDTEGGVRVVIGEENKEEALRNCSVVLTSYGIPKKAMGTMGVVGPTRMNYGLAISTTRYLSSLMSELMSELYR
jgi:heat-inducible transcriptional repressor